MSLLLDIFALVMAAFTLILVLTVLSYLLVTHIPYVPSKTAELEKFLERHGKNNIPQKKHFYDLGSGDGRTLFLAEKYGFHPIGYELSPLPYLLTWIGKMSRRSAAGVFFRNFLKADLSGADYVYCYLFPELTQTAFEKISRECRPGSFFICNTFRVKSREPQEILYDKKQKPRLFIYQI